MHLLSLLISLELKGRTLTATFTEAPAMVQGSGVRVSRRPFAAQNTHLEPAQVEDERDLTAMHKDRMLFVFLMDLNADFGYYN